MADIYTSGLPPELLGQSQELERKRAIVQALMQQSMQAPQATNPGPIASRVSPLTNLLRIFSAAGGARAEGEVQKGYTDLAGKYNTGMQSAVGDYMRQRGGSPAQAISPLTPNDDEGNPMPGGVKDAVMPDPMGAVTRGLTSGYGPIRELAKADLTANEKMQLTPKDLLAQKDLDPESKVLVARMLAANIPLATALQFVKPGRDVRTVGDSLVEVPKAEGAQPRSLGFFGATATPQGPAAPAQPTGGGFLPTGQPGEAAAAPVDFPLPPGARRNPGDPPGVFRIKGADGQDDVYQTQYKGGQLTGYKKLDNAPKVTVNNEIKFGNKWSEAQAELLKKKLEASHGTATEAKNDLNLLSTAIQAYNSGITTGSFQGARNAIDRAAETAGFKSQDPKISNTDLFMRTMAQRILQHTKELRPMSDTDRKYLEDILAGKNLDDRGIQRVLEIGVENSIKNIHSHNNALAEDYSQLEGTMPGFLQAYRVKLPTNEEGEFRLKIGPDTPQPQGTLRPYSGG